MTITPFTALGWTASALLALLVLGTLQGLGVYVVAMFVYGMSAVKERRYIFTVAKWMLPFVVPLFLIHGVINPGFAETGRIAGLIPVRADGLSFASLVSLRVVAITFVASYWAAVPANHLVDAFIQWRAPLRLVVLASQAIAVGQYIGRRANQVLLAQRARGIPVGPGFLARARAFPTIIVPVISSALLDADVRAHCLVTRGLGVAAIEPWSKKDVELKEWLIVAFSFLLVLVLGVIS